MLELVHKIRRKSETEAIKFLINPDSIGYSDIKKFATKKSDWTEPELDHLEAEAKIFLVNLKESSDLVYDFRKLNGLKRAYLHLAKFISGSIYKISREHISYLSHSVIPKSSSGRSIYQEKETLKEEVSQEKIEPLNEELAEKPEVSEPKTSQVCEDVSGSLGMASGSGEAVDLSKYIGKLPPHNDDLPFEDFINKMTAFFDLCTITADSSQIKLLKYSVADKRKIYSTLSAIPISEPANFKNFSNECIQLLDGKIRPCEGQVYSAAWSIRSSNYSTLKEYFQAFVELKAEAADPAQIRESSLIECFLRGLPENLEMMVRGEKSRDKKKDHTLLDMYKFASEIRPDRQDSFQVNSYNFGNSKNSQPKKNLNFNKNNKQRNFRKSDLLCKACGKSGHEVDDCYKLKEFLNLQKKKKKNLQKNIRVNNAKIDENFDERESWSGNETDKNGLGFFGGSKTENTGDVNSALEAIPVLVSSTEDTNIPVPQLSENHSDNSDFEAVDFPESPIVYKVNFQKLITHHFLIKISGKNFEWTPILDSGGQRSTISLKFANKIGAKIIETHNFKVIGFDGTTSKNVVGYIKELHFVDPDSGNSGIFSPIIIKDENSNLCGLDIFNICKGGRFSKTSDDKLAFEFEPAPNRPHPPDIRIKSSQSFKILPGEYKVATIQKIETNTDLLISSKNSKNNKIHAIDGIVDSNTQNITIFNSSLNDTITIQKDQCLANGFEADLNIELGEIPDSNNIAHKSEGQKLSDQDFQELVKPKLTHIQNKEKKDKLISILTKYKDVFDVASKNSVGQYPREISINPYDKNITVKAEKRRTFNPNVWSQLNIELDKLLDLGLIEDCPYPTISPANLVAAKRKGSDKIRLCVDFRRLNEEICGNYFPLPTKAELFDSLGQFDQSAVFIQLDVASCFWNFKLQDKDKHLTAFYTQDGVKQWKVLPFGVKSAPGIVQHALSGLTKGLGLDSRTSRSHFIDDDAYCVKNFDTALTDLEKILSAYKSINLKVKLEKCSFLTKTIFFMGSE